MWVWGVPGDPGIWAWSGLTRVSDGRGIRLMRGSIPPTHFKDRKLKVYNRR